MSAPGPRTMSAIPEGWRGRPLAETRWALESARLLLDPVAYGLGVPHGDGRTVVVLPGFLAGDGMLTMLQVWLWGIGYRPATTGIHFNVDCSDRTIDRIERTVAALAEQTGRRVAVVGHSRGGHFARAIGARRPELVSHAVSLGADLQGLYGISSPTRAAVGMARNAMRLTHSDRPPECFRSRCTCDFIRDYTAAFPADRVRLTSVYSKGDGVVRWERAIVDEAHCVEVGGSHMGMVANRAVYHAIADALAELELLDAHE